MNWNLESHRVSAKYLGKFPITGIVELSRVKYGGGVSHHVVLDNPIMVYGAERERVIIDHCQVETISDNRSRVSVDSADDADLQS